MAERTTDWKNLAIGVRGGKRKVVCPDGFIQEPEGPGIVHTPNKRYISADDMWGAVDTGKALAHIDFRPSAAKPSGATGDGVQHTGTGQTGIAHVAITVQQCPECGHGAHTVADCNRQVNHLGEIIPCGCRCNDSVPVAKRKIIGDTKPVQGVRVKMTGKIADRIFEDLSLDKNNVQVASGYKYQCHWCNHRDCQCSWLDRMVRALQAANLVAKGPWQEIKP
jgi:hypothetical protein